MKTYKEFMEDSYMKRKIAGQRTARKSKKKREREETETRTEESREGKQNTDRIYS